MQPHLALVCLICWGLVVEAKISTGLLQRAKRFSQFKTVRIGQVWNELKSNKVVSFTLTRDLTVVGELIHGHSPFQVLVCPDALALSPPDLLERLHRGEQAHRPPWLRLWHRPQGRPRQDRKLLYEPKDSVSKPDGLQWLCKCMISVVIRKSLFSSYWLPSSGWSHLSSGNPRWPQGERTMVRIWILFILTLLSMVPMPSQTYKKKLQVHILLNIKIDSSISNCHQECWQPWWPLVQPISTTGSSVQPASSRSSPSTLSW